MGIAARLGEPHDGSFTLGDDLTASMASAGDIQASCQHGLKIKASLSE
jgi:hypothetical protein